MTLKVYTARVTYAGADRFDVTRKAGDVHGKVFAPSWASLRPAIEEMQRAQRLIANGREPAVILDGENARRRAWGAYLANYLREMHASRREHPEAWASLLAVESRTLVCFCASADWCHRSVLAAHILPTMGAVYMGERA